MLDTRLTPAYLRERPELIEDVFFSAMLHGYAGSRPPKKNAILLFPGTRHIEYHKELWRVTDTYEVNMQSGTSFGTTRIYLKYGDAEVPVWVMQYWGRYGKDHTDFLKRALHFQYSKRRFNGGRGPNNLAYEGLRYTNEAQGDGIANFFGIERVTSDKGGTQGFHRYQGGILI